MSLCHVCNCPSFPSSTTITPPRPSRRPQALTAAAPYPAADQFVSTNTIDPSIPVANANHRSPCGAQESRELRDWRDWRDRGSSAPLGECQVARSVVGELTKRTRTHIRARQRRIRARHTTRARRFARRQRSPPPAQRTPQCHNPPRSTLPGEAIAPRLTLARPA